MSPPSQASTPPASPPFQGPPLESDLPGFTTPHGAPANPSASPSSGQQPAAAFESGPLEPGKPDGNEGRSKGRAKRSRASTDPTDPLAGRPPTKRVTADPAAFAGVFRALLEMLSFVFHLRLAPKHVENDVWLADEQDLKTISAPLSRIAARHAPLDGPGGDVGDVIEVLIGTGGYVIKNTIKGAQLQQPPGWEQQDEQAQAAATGAPEPAPAQPFQPFPPG